LRRFPSRRARCLSGAVALVSMFGAAAGTAHADEILSRTVSVDDAQLRTCHASLVADATGVDVTALSAPVTGWIRAQLEGEGDWDVAVFDRSSGRLVAGSAHRDGSELAEGIVGAGDELAVQACRRSGDGRSATLTIGALEVSTTLDEKLSLVRISVPNALRRQELTNLGLDLTEHGGEGFVEAVLRGSADAQKLRDHKFVYTTEVSDLSAQSKADRKKEKEYEETVERSGLPSGRTSYRRLFDYSSELKDLVEEHPDIVRPITLAHRSYEGRPVEGIEITTNVGNVADGKPVFLQMGTHHAREWPSAEHAMEWAYELVRGYRLGDDRVERLMGSVRTIVVPVVNPDGFNISREAGTVTAETAGGGGNEIVNILTHPYEYRRKNCRLPDDSQAGSCAAPALGLVENGVDPNRNYGGFWGGPGASFEPMNLTYRGPGPFSEPETQNIRELVSARQVTALITNHTFSNLVLRPPGIQALGETPDEPAYKALGDAMAAKNGYTSQFSYQLYDTTGTTEDWTYYATGGFGFTFEIGPRNFHPPFQNVVAEYEGTTTAANGGGGNREAYYTAMEAGADPGKHSVLSGKAPAGAILRAKKTFLTRTSEIQQPGGRFEDARFFEDTLETTMSVPASGRYLWHVNPSTRPISVTGYSRPATGTPSPAESFAGAPALPCADYDTEDPTCWNDHAFTVPGGDGTDNARAIIRLDWPTPASDYDMKIFRDADGDGSSAGETELVGSSGQGATNWEQSVVAEPALEPGGKYVVRVINWAAVEPYSGTITYKGPEPYSAPQTESWTVTCERPDGTVMQRTDVVVARGERARVDFKRCD
jgi:hypothetical protein